jgi:DNA polymerase-3 subunit gamma/tau
VSYLVLARKYRPQRFDDLVGQEHVARTLVNAIQLGRVHHAFLFTGARGVGKTSAARILARALCCVKGPTATPCGSCDFCQEIVSGQSVDVLEIDGASHTGVDDVRTLREGVRYAPSKGRRKVYIIDEVHMLSTSAFNALLKTLEEPPAHVVFVFATTEVHKIPTTILSRCQRYDFKLVPTARLVEHLTGVLGSETIQVEPDALRLLARQAGGSVRDSLSLLDQVIAFVGDATITRERVAEVLGVADQRLHVALLEAILARDPGRALRQLDQALDKGVDLLQLGRSFLGYVHDVEIAGLVADPGDLLDATAEEVAEAKTLCGKAPRGSLPAMFDRWARAVDDAGRSQTPRLVLEMALLDLCAIEPMLPLGDLLQRLSELEGRLGPGGAPPSPTRSGAGPGAGAGGAAGGPPRRGGASPGGASPGTSASAGLAPSAAHSARLSSDAWPEVTAAPPSAAVARAPEPVAAPRAAKGAPAPEEAWRLLRLRFEDRPAVGAILDHAEVLTWERGRVTLRMPDRLVLERAEKHRALIEQTLAEMVGAPASLSLQLGGARATAAPLVGAEITRQSDAAAEDKRLREQEARNHPIIQRAQEIFGVNAREVKT